MIFSYASNRIDQFANGARYVNYKSLQIIVKIGNLYLNIKRIILVINCAFFLS